MADSDLGSLTFDEWESIAQHGAFEESLAALREVVANLEAGALRLNDAVRCYELGAGLARRCETLLAEAELRISRLESFNGNNAEIVG